VGHMDNVESLKSVLLRSYTGLIHHTYYETSDRTCMPSSHLMWSWLSPALSQHLAARSKLRQQDTIFIDVHHIQNSLALDTTVVVNTQHTLHDHNLIHL